MDAEILFFMTTKDQSEFLTVAKEHCDSINKVPNSNTLVLQVASYRLLLTPSILEENILYIGKLEIRMSLIAETVEPLEQERVKTAFRTLRNWIKKHYWSRLAYLNRNKKGKLTPSRNHWLGPDAKCWKEGDIENRKLKLSKTSWMIFELGY